MTERSDGNTERITDEDYMDAIQVINKLRARVRELEKVEREIGEISEMFAARNREYNALREAVRVLVDCIKGCMEPQEWSGAETELIRVYEGGGDSCGDGAGIQRSEQADQPALESLRDAGNNLAEYLQRALGDMESFGSNTNLERAALKMWKELVEGGEGQGAKAPESRESTPTDYEKFKAKHPELLVKAERELAESEAVIADRQEPSGDCEAPEHALDKHSEFWREINKEPKE